MDEHIGRFNVPQLDWSCLACHSIEPGAQLVLVDVASPRSFLARSASAPGSPRLANEKAGNQNAAERNRPLCDLHPQVVRACDPIGPDPSLPGCASAKADGHAGVVDAHDPRIRVEWEVEGLGGSYLRDQADIRDGWPVAMAERAALGMFGEQRLNRLQAGAKPMLDRRVPALIAIARGHRRLPAAEHPTARPVPPQRPTACK
jgi:hypothetical protein